MHRSGTLTLIACTAILAACGDPPPTAVPSASPSRSTSPSPSLAAASASSLSTRVVHTGWSPVSTGEPIDLAELAGRIVFDDFEDVFAMDVDGSDVVRVADDPAGPEFDGAWSPDGAWVVYRDSTRGINVDDELVVARADGSERRNLTNVPANDWGPDWSPGGSTIAFNSDRDGGRIRGYLVDPDGSDLRPIGIDAWVEYPSFPPDGTRIVYMGHAGSDYDIYVADLASGAVEQLTDGPAQDGWPVWSPDGTTIAFTSTIDDCALRPPDEECWDAGPDDEHRDVWLMAADGSDPRRVTTESGQFVAWSPDGRYLLISGRALFVVRPDGSGRLELRAEGIDLALGGIPDWR